jgi:hypothetical protein
MKRHISTMTSLANLITKSSSDFHLCSVDHIRACVSRSHQAFCSCWWASFNEEEGEEGKREKEKER